jgi:kynurenine 3-monooxygenase
MPDAIAELSYRNFRDEFEKLADENFLLQKKIENGSPINILENGFHYTKQRTFSDRPYAEALAIGIIKMKLCKRF